ncbi:hypothetical protein AB0383_20060 [Amycolatopsis sp. NPDC051373]|uniref:hypothetical protein n=1 Tax=Amycolatopsis sp. NPDC051373 TaxID=3155801 RepID=UPI003450E726
MNTTPRDTELRALRVVPDLESPWMTSHEAATYARCNVETVRRATRLFKKTDGRRGLKAIQRSDEGHYLIHVDDLLRWAANRAPSTGTRRYRAAA